MAPDKIVLTVAPDGSVRAKTENVIGERCLDYIAVLENLLEATTASSAYTADFARTATATTATEEERNELRET